MRNKSILLALPLALSGGAASFASTIDTIKLESSTLESFADNYGTLFSLTATQPTGSGTFFPFMRIQRIGDAQGYNSSQNNSPSATMDLINLPGNSSSTLVMNNVVTSDNRIFLTLDYNEQGSSGKSLITLEELILVVSTDPDKTGPVGPKHNDPWSIQNIPFTAGDQVIYQMSNSLDGSGNAFNILLNAQKNPANGNGGSGAADLNVTVDVANVSNLGSLLDANHYLYVYSRFSGAGAGFEEWNSFEKILPNGNPGGGPPGVPEPASLAVLSLGAAGLLVRRRKA